jgi:glyoxylase-like metal-dependent hydrolase (beta-lactamase superfamily II)
VRLTKDVVLVGGSPTGGFGISPGFDAHCYLLDGGGELALVDCGGGTQAGMARVFDNIRAAGVDPHRISHLLLTHYHTDHAGGAARYRERLGLAVGISAEAASVLETADHDATGFAVGQRLGMWPADFDYSPCPVDIRLEDGDVLALGQLTIRFIATPGHCAGHGSYLVDSGTMKYLFSGDAVFAMGKVAILATKDCDLQALLDSVRRLGAEEFDALMPGHAAIVLHDGTGHVRRAVETIERLSVPRNWFD